MTIGYISSLITSILLTYMVFVFGLGIALKLISKFFSIKIKIINWAAYIAFILAIFMLFGIEDEYKYHNVYDDNRYEEMITFFKGVLILSFICVVEVIYLDFKKKLKDKRELDIINKNTEIKSIEEKRKQEEQAKWQLELDREVERERRLAEVRHESTIMAMRSQVALYAEYKEKGLSVEKEIFEMRAKLLELEGQENKTMLDEIRTTLDSLA